MSDLDKLYARLLQVGFVVLAQAIESGCPDWAQAEVEWLHNIPSLLGETNLERHRYFWEQERGQCLDWIAARGSKEAKSRMRTYYEPILDELEPLVAQRISAARSN